MHKQNVQKERKLVVMELNLFVQVGEVVRLEALAVNDGWAGLVVFLLGDPHLLEGGEGSKDGSSDPDGVLALWWGDDLDLHENLRWGKSGDFLLHTISNSWVHGGSSRKNGVGVQVLTDINVALHDRVVRGLVDSGGLHTQEGWLEESLWATEAFVSDGDDLSVRKLVGLLEGRGGGSGGHLLLEVEGDVAELLLDVTNDLALSGGGERVTTLGKDLHEVISKITSSQVKTEDGVWESVSFVDWDGVGDTISRVEDDSGGTSGSVEGEDGLDGDIHGWGVEGLEHDLSHLFTVSLWVKWGFGEEDWVLFWGNTELVVEGVVPDLLHIIPVGDDTVLNWVLKVTSLGLGLVSDVGILLSHTDHDSLMTWSSDDGWEDGTWSVVSGESGLAHSGSIVNNKSGNLVVTHFD